MKKFTHNHEHELNVFKFIFKFMCKFSMLISTINFQRLYSALSTKLHSNLFCCQQKNAFNPKECRQKISFSPYFDPFKSINQRKLLLKEHCPALHASWALDMLWAERNLYILYVRPWLLPCDIAPVE